MTTSSAPWSFDLITFTFPDAVLPNIKFWNVTNNLGLSYQVQVSWPLKWTSPDEAEGTVLSMYVLDGNALGMTATEAWRRRAFIDPSQPDGIIVSIGYPVTDSVYSPQRNIDFKPRTPGQEQPGALEGGADDMLDFIDGTLRPFIHLQFPKVRFSRDALYGHSLGGLFVVYALLRRPGLFDTYLAASPGSGNWDSAILSKWSHGAGTSDVGIKPALRLAYGTLEAHPVRRRTETEEAFQARAKFYATFSVAKTTNDIYQYLKGYSGLRDVEIKEYSWSDHASLGAEGLTDGIDYFIDW